MNRYCFEFQVQWYAGLWDFWDLVVEILDFSHFRNPAFLVFAFSNFLLYMWYDVPYVYIADSGMSMGFNESQSSMLISIIGIVNMFGEVLTTYDNYLSIYCLVLWACGVLYVTNYLPTCFNFQRII